MRFYLVRQFPAIQFRRSGLAPGNWGSIKYNNPANKLRYAVLRYGGIAHQRGSRNYGLNDHSTNYTGNKQTVWIAGSTPGVMEVRDSVLEYSYEKAIHVESGQTAWVHDNTIRRADPTTWATRSATYGVYVNGPTAVENNTISEQDIGIDARASGVSIDGNTTLRGKWGIVTRAGGSVTNNVSRLNTYPVYQSGAGVTYPGNLFAGNTNPVIGVGETVNWNHWGPRTTWSSSPAIATTSMAATATATALRWVTPATGRECGHTCVIDIINGIRASVVNGKVFVSES